MSPNTDRRVPAKIEKVAALAMSVLLLVITIFGVNAAFPATKAYAAAMGPGIYDVPGIGWIGAYKTSGGNIIYCTERGVPDPFSPLPPATKVSTLDAYTWSSAQGTFTASAVTSATKMRQLNYMLDTYGRSGDNLTVAGLAVAVWLWRADSQINIFKNALNSSSKGKQILEKGNAILSEAVTKAVAPKAAPSVNENLKIILDENQQTGKVTYPAGTTSLQLENASFKNNNASVLQVSGSDAGTAEFTVADPQPKNSYQVSVKGTWKTNGTKGWPAEVWLYQNTSPREQAAARSVGSSTPSSKQGNFSTQTVTVPQAIFPIKVQTQAQPDAEVGGTMFDTAMVEGTVQPQSYIEFTAYLLPEAGSKKYDPEWKEILNFPTNESLEDNDAEPVDSEPSDSDEVGPSDIDGLDVYSTVERWREDEIDALSFEQKCTLQPIAKTGRITVTAEGEYRSPEIKVKSPGTIYWVERYFEGSKLIHEGKCGLANEKTVIGGPAVVTQAQTEASIGEQIIDTAIVTGTLSKRADYSIIFEAFRADYKDELPVCDRKNRIFRSEEIPVTEVGEIYSPGFQAMEAHGETIWWIETLRETIAGNSRIVHRGECGLENETTSILRPHVTTKAIESVPVGDRIFDTAVVTGNFEANSNTRYELNFSLYSHKEEGGSALCEHDNLLATTDTIQVSGPGEYTSPLVDTSMDFIPAVWWVERLWVIESDGDSERKTLLHKGECGIYEETTAVENPRVSTQSISKAQLGEEIYDTALVEGHLSERPDVTHFLTFEIYKEDYDVNQNPSCLEENRIYAGEPMPIEKDGEYESQRLIATEEYRGTLWWVETLTQVNSNGYEEVLHRGECGLPNETTEIDGPVVTTKALPQAKAGEKIYDVATVYGDFDLESEIRYSVAFEAFLQPLNSSEPKCDIQNRIFDSDSVPVKGKGEYVSPKFQTTNAHIGTIFWVETLYVDHADNSMPVYRGKCGEVGETTVVTPAIEELAQTGSSFNRVLAVAMLASSLIFGGYVLMRAGKGRKRAS